MSVFVRRRPLLPESHRCLYVITEPQETISRLKSAPCLRVLLGFNFRFGSSMNLSDRGLRLIRVINLDGATSLKVLPKEIGGLVNMRYLSFWDTSIESPTKTIKNLSRL